MTGAQKIIHPDDNELAAFVDGTLERAARARVESHLVQCLACRSLLAAYAQTISNMSPMSEPKVEPWRKPFRFFGLWLNRRPVWALPLAASLLIALVVTALILPWKEPSPPPQVVSVPPSPPTAVEPPSFAPVGPRKRDILPPSSPAPKSTEPEAEPPREPEFSKPDLTLLARRGGRKIVDDKTFHFRDGVWVDAAYEAASELPLIEVKKGSPAYQHLLAKYPILARYADVGREVLVVFEGKAYKFTR